MTYQARNTNRGFIKYIVLFIILVVIIATFNIDVNKIITHPFVQDVWYYIKVVIAFIINAFDKVFGEFQKDDVINTVASTTQEILEMASSTSAN
jgi:hypothetical protein